MELRWRLDDLYPSFESEVFQHDFAGIDEEIEQIDGWVKSNLGDMTSPAEKMQTYIEKRNRLGHLLSRLRDFAELRLSVEATNQTALQYTDRLQTKAIALRQPTVVFMKWLASLEDLDEIISRSPLLQAHTFFLKETAAQAKYILNEKEEAIVATLENTGSTAWVNLQNLLSSTLLVDINVDGEDKKLPLPVVRNLYYDKNAATRKTAYEAELAAYERVEQSSCACLNAVKGEVLALSKIRGYESPIDMTLIQSRMDRQTLEVMLKAMKESLPILRQYYRRKAELIGHKQGLPFYDLFAPVGKLHADFTYQEARAIS